MEDKNNFLGSIYNDFFKPGSLKNNQDKLDQELAAITEQLKNMRIETKTESISDIVSRKEDEVKIEKSVEFSKEDKDKKVKDFFERIDNLYITEKSKETLKKMVQYARNYQEKIVKNYIPFDMRLYSDNSETTYAVVTLLAEVFGYFKYIKGSEIYDASFYQIDTENLVNIYESKYNFLLFRDFDGIIAQKEMQKESLLIMWESKILKQEDKKITIAVEKNKQKIDDALSNHVVLKDRIFDFEIEAIKPDEQDVYNDLLEKLKSDYPTTEEFDLKLLDYIIGTYNRTELTYPEYRDSLYDKIVFNKTEEKITEKTLPDYEKDKSIEAIFKELNELVGLKNVKTMLNDLVSLMQFREKAGNEVNIKSTNLHMVFLGNPGTGKTTVARMVAGILYNLKYIKQNKLLEVSAKDLVGEYVGQTGPKTMAVIEKAMGGVLFIDEAYSLASKPGQNSSFNEECVATLIQAMENYRENLVVIFAGYSKEMQDFLNSNSGIVSRIGYTMEFEDYETDELISIFKSMTKKAGFIVEDEAIKKVESIIEEYKNTENFGNARFIRNLYEKTIIKHAANCANKKSKKALKTIVSEDISVENLIKM
ncbi:MAG: AAA family ATPase [Clostridia bacterium]|nr:AAA family ATPase [Clostridia bacterium]